MRSRVALNVVLLIVVLTLSGVVLLTPEKANSPIVVKLTDMEPADIGVLRIERSGQRDITLEKKAQTSWWLSQPLALRADPKRVQSLLEITGATSHTQLDANAHDLTRFGLDRPKVTLLLGDRQLIFGDTESLSGRRYVLTDSRIHLITDQFYHYLNATVPSFVNPAILDPEAVPVELELPALHLSFDGIGWETSPPHLQLEPDAANSLVGAWKEARAVSVRVYDEALSRDNVVRIRLEGQAQHIRFDFVSEPHRFVLGRPDLGIQYELDPNAARHLLGVSVSPSES